MTSSPSAYDPDWQLDNPKRDSDGRQVRKVCPSRRTSNGMDTVLTVGDQDALLPRDNAPHRKVRRTGSIGIWTHTLSCHPYMLTCIVSFFCLGTREGGSGCTVTLLTRLRLNHHSTSRISAMSFRYGSTPASRRVPLRKRLDLTSVNKIPVMHALQVI